LQGLLRKQKCPPKKKSVHVKKRNPLRERTLSRKTLQEESPGSQVAHVSLKKEPGSGNTGVGKKKTRRKRKKIDKKLHYDGKEECSKKTDNAKQVDKFENDT